MIKKPFHYHGNSIEAIVLDVDDTIVITQPIFEVSCETLVITHGYDPQPLQSYIAAVKKGEQKIISPMEKAWKWLYPELTEKEAGRWVEIYQQIAKTHFYKPITDAEHFLNRCLNNVKLGFCTNELLEIAIHRLATAGINPDVYFPEHHQKGFVIINGKCIGHKKPDPKALQYFIELWNIKPEELLMIGDMKTDFEVAQNIGAHGAIILSNSYTRQTMEHHVNGKYIFDSLTDLLMHLQQ